MSDTIEKKKYTLRHFEGPLDLLLFLIKKNEINIYDIPVSEITEQYLSLIDLSVKIDMEEITEFYSMAATLLYIKSRMLLPVDDEIDTDIEDPRQELVAKLIEYQKYKKLTDMMASKNDESEWHIERQKKQIILPFSEEDDLWEKLEIWELVKCFSSLMNNLSRESIVDIYEDITVNEKITLINELIEEKGFCFFSELIIRPDSWMDSICSFLAVLEVVKISDIEIRQNRLFGDIKLIDIKKNVGISS